MAALRLSFEALLVSLLLPCGASATVAAVGADFEFNSLPDVINRIKQRTLATSLLTTSSDQEMQRRSKV